ncbi:MAG: sensor histidine kinase [Thermoplasmata archaeon]|nr:sensor histidine kinase [Thermoplasmata archaeon]
MISVVRERISSRIGVKVVAIFLVVVAILTALAVFALREARDSLVSSIGTDSLHLVQSTAVSVDTSVYLKYHELWLLGSGDFVQMELMLSNIEFDAMSDPEGYIDSVEEEWSSTPSTETTPLMDEILENNISVSVRETLVHHYSEEHGYAIYGSVVVANKYGVVAGMDKSTASYSQDLAAWWPTFMEEGRLFSEVEYDPWLGIHTMVVAVKLSDSEGAFSGAIIGHLDIVSLVEQTVYLGKPYETTEMQIVRSDGLVIFSSSAFTMFENASEEPYFEMMVGQSGYFLFGEGENEKLYSYSTATGYLLYPGNEWMVVVDHKASEVLSAVDNLSSSVMTVAFPIIGLSVAVSYLFALSLSRRVREVARAAQEFSAGERDKRVSTGGFDEIGQLGKSFNFMADELSGLWADLEGKVADRTRAVEQANRKLRLLGSITRHDALNQISIISGWISLAEESTDDKELLATLAKIKNAAVNLAANLEFTRVYEKVGIKKPEWLQMDRTLTHSLFGMGPYDFKLHNDLGDVQVYCDPMIQNVLRNLVDNSIRHGGGVSRISFTSSETPDGLMIVYEDDGKGIPYGDKEAIFEPGTQPGKKSYGLYLTREILSITGITIRESGVPGKGVRFEILVPEGRYRLSHPGRKLKDDRAE